MNPEREAKLIERVRLCLENGMGEPWTSDVALLLDEVRWLRTELDGLTPPPEPHEDCDCTACVAVSDAWNERGELRRSIETARETLKDIGQCKSS